MYNSLLLIPLKWLISLNAVKRTPYRSRVLTTWWFIHGCPKVGSDTKYFLSHHMRGFSFCAQILNFSYFSRYQKYIHRHFWSALSSSFLENGLLFELICTQTSSASIYSFTYKLVYVSYMFPIISHFPCSSDLS